LEVLMEGSQAKPTVHSVYVLLA